jgi:hypothetical protein
MTGPGPTALLPRGYAAGDEIDQIADGMIAFARTLRRLRARMPVGPGSQHLSFKVENVGTLKRHAEDLGIEVTERNGHYRAVLPFGPGFAYVLWADASAAAGA